MKTLKWVQGFVGTFLYYAQTTNSTMQTETSSIVVATTTSTIIEIRTRINHFLDYTKNHPKVSIKYVACSVCLWVYLNAFYFFVKPRDVQELEDTPT